MASMTSLPAGVKTNTESASRSDRPPRTFASPNPLREESMSTTVYTPTGEDAARLEALKAAGWELASARDGHSAPNPSGKGTVQLAPGHFVLTRLWRGSTVHETGACLEEALERASWQQ